MLRYVFIPSLCIYQLSASFKEVHYGWWVQLSSAPLTIHNMIKTTYISKHQSGTQNLNNPWWKNIKSYDDSQYITIHNSYTESAAVQLNERM
jgi:hypothetical protein